jgi:hypothetical protein
LGNFFDISSILSFHIYFTVDLQRYEKLLKESETDFGSEPNFVLQHELDFVTTLVLLLVSVLGCLISLGLIL